MKFFKQLFDLVQANSGGIIALLADDVTILARSPDVPGETGGPHPDSELRQQMLAHPQAPAVLAIGPFSMACGGGSYRHLNEFPLSTVVSQSEWDVQSSWRAALIRRFYHDGRRFGRRGASGLPGVSKANRMLNV